MKKRMLLLVLLPASLFSQYFKQRPDVLTLRYLLTNRLYADVQARLESYQQAFEEDYTYEARVWAAFSAFDCADPSLGAYLTEWITRSPKSPLAYAARARYYLRAGWESRGHGWASETSEGQFVGMEKYFTLAKKDIETALSLNPRLTFCHSMAIQIATNYGDNVSSKMLLNQALKVHPEALEIRVRYMWSLTPRWGGSYDAMEAFATESEGYLERNPRLRVLRGCIPSDKGDMLHIQTRDADALGYFDEALRFGERASFYTQRGDSYYALKDYDRALEDYEAALGLAWQDASLLRSKAQALIKLQRMDEARHVLSMAQQIDPSTAAANRGEKAIKTAESYDHHKRAYELSQEGKYAGAIEEYTAAISSRPDDSQLYANRGTVYLQLGKMQEAIDDLRRATDGDPNDDRSYYNLGWIYLSQGKYELAREMNTKAIGINREYGYAYLNRSNALAKLGRTDEATQDLRRACDLGIRQACDFLRQLGK